MYEQYLRVLQSEELPSKPIREIWNTLNQERMTKGSLVSLLSRIYELFSNGIKCMRHVGV